MGALHKMRDAANKKCAKISFRGKIVINHQGVTSLSGSYDERDFSSSLNMERQRVAMHTASSNVSDATYLLKVRLNKETQTNAIKMQRMCGPYDLIFLIINLQYYKINSIICENSA